MTSSKLENHVCVGRFIGPHGIRGLGKIKFFGDDPAVLDEYGALINAQTGNDITFKRKHPQKDCWIVQVDDIEDRTTIEQMGKFDIYLDKSRLEQLDDDEFYFEELIGLETRLSDGTVTGTIRHVHDYGPTDLLEIKPSDKPSFMLPFTKEMVPEIHIKDGYIIINPLDGMMP